MTLWAILPAAGIGQRMGSAIPKQYLPLAGQPVIQHTLDKLTAVPGLSRIVVAIHPEDNHFRQLDIDSDYVEPTVGGDSRQQSVMNALNVIAQRAKNDDWVLVHDAVRPCVQLSDIDKLLGAIADHAIGGLLAAPQDNTLKRADETLHVAETVDRSEYWQALTPQIFRFGLLFKAIQKTCKEGITTTDEASAIEVMGYKPLLVSGDRNNIKITRESDLSLAESILNLQQH
ncbi:MAG: 2-C-methyl-D-erythritol 4-phosphate cytidylyltransferase [Pseudomonadales bacterium]|nr:2-C-methyl-D-erythritol 4-phosphate cytidylyltransferase [Pseudomonadales bacterium]